MNTAMGNILAIIASISVLFTGVDGVILEMGIPKELIVGLAPFFVAMINCLSPLTACAISIEGKGWELTKSLPVTTKTVMNAKLLLQFTFSIPSSIISSTCLAIALKPSGLALVWLFAIPLVFATFIAVAGLFVNAKNPSFTWDNESVPVKQSSATLISMVISLISGIVPVLLIAFLPARFCELTTFGLLLVVFALAWLFYKKLVAYRLNDIDEK
jgi:ABC-2 type transport system permease protein